MASYLLDPKLLHGDSIRPIPLKVGYLVDIYGGVWHQRGDKYRAVVPWKSVSASGRVYLKVDLGRKVRAKFVHRLVLLAFRGPAPEGRGFACHLDDDPQNNALSNLKWADQKTNERHKTQAPCVCSGEMADHHDVHGYCTAKHDGKRCDCREYRPARKPA